MTERRRTLWLWGVLPLALVGALSAVLITTGVLDSLRVGIPPVEELSFDRVTLSQDQITVRVVNGGVDPVTIAQVMVDDAYWDFEITPSNRVNRLGRATITIPYPWVRDEAHVITLLSSTGVTFSHEIAVATPTPTPGLHYLSMFALVGLYVGVIPVAIGLLWYPLLRQLERRWIHFALALTAGLLVFLGADALHEAFEAADRVPGAFDGTLVVVVGALGTLLILELVSRSRARRDGPGGRLWVAGLIALGIGMHNLGEGLAIGAAYALGEAALGAFLIVGFMLHNTTEGLGIVAPIAKDRPKLAVLGGLGLLAGAPTILGAWIGGMAYSPLIATLFLAVGAGAIAQVLLALHRVVARETDGMVWSPVTASGVLAGLAIMYGTGLLVAV
jgi:ZIP family zinc transporter